MVSLSGFASSGSGKGQGKTILDTENRLVSGIPKGATLVIRPFSTEGTDFGSGGEGGKESRVEAASIMKESAPGVLAGAVKAAAAEGETFAKVLVDAAARPPRDGVVLEGRFVRIDPGSRAKRFFVGFGAGVSGVAVAGRLVAADGTILATFEHARHSGLGMYGGEYVKFLTDDARDVGTDIGTFLVAFAGGTPPR
jgi:hypothetical protein